MTYTNFFSNLTLRFLWYVHNKVSIFVFFSRRNVYCYLDRIITLMKKCSVRFVVICINVFCLWFFIYTIAQLYNIIIITINIGTHDVGMRETKSLLDCYIFPLPWRKRFRRIHTVAQVIDDVVDTVALVAS